MQSLPILASLLAAAVLAPAALEGLKARGLVRPNYRQAELPCPTGIVIVGAALIALAPLALLQRLAGAEALAPATGAALAYVVGVALLGLVDDVAGGSARGWRGHARAGVRSHFSTGALKAAGALGLALFVLLDPALLRGPALADYLIAVAVLVLATNFFNLLDLRPGRSAKAFVLLGAGLTLASLDAGGLWALGLFVGPVLVLLPLDLRERGMLGDTGASAIGAVAGLWLVLTLPTAGLAVALALLAIATVYGEFRSISALIERTPGLRRLDSLGRMSHA